MCDFLKKNHKHILCITITLISLTYTIFYFKFAHGRIYESFIDVGTTSKYFVSEMFNLNLTGRLTILEYTKMPFEMPFNLPNSWEEFKELWKRYWDIFFSWNSFLKYLSFVGNLIFYFSRYLIILLPVFIIIGVVRDLKGKKSNNDHGVESKQLIKFKQLEKKYFVPFKAWFISFIEFIKNNRIYYLLWLLIWAYNFNFITIGIEFISYYLYFAASFDKASLYVQAVKLLMDLSIVIDFVPGFIWFLMIWKLFDIWGIKIGYNKLNHMEAMDRGFIDERPVVTMFVGSMGKRKTTMLTDVSISTEIMFRDKAFEKLQEQDMKFPFFSWILFENSIKRAIENHLVFNLATCRKFIQNRKKYFEKMNKNKIYLWNYDYKRYGLYYDNKLFVEYIWDVLETYCQLYFIYLIESSLLISNYSVRVDNILLSNGNFELWDTELFKRSSNEVSDYSRHAHILDFDALRLGKNLIEDNKYANSFEFGIINITEIGKERGNTLELQHLKKNDDSCNQKNDLFNSTIKMIRHSATVDNYPFVKFYTDEQRPESWGADARDLCEIVYINKSSELKIAHPFFFIRDLIIQLLVGKHSSHYYDHRFRRGDNTLFMYLYHGLVSKLFSYRKRMYNTFGFYKMNLDVEDGRMETEAVATTYFLMSKKIYSKRFSTDCFSDFFNEKSLRSEFGLNDIDEFATEKATFEEMKKENSYFFNDLCKIKEKGKK